jgi:hypothetical protein
MSEPTITEVTVRVSIQHPEEVSPEEATEAACEAVDNAISSVENGDGFTCDQERVNQLRYHGVFDPEVILEQTA